MWVVPTTLWAGPAELLSGEELWGEQGLLPGAIPHPLLDALKVEEAEALYTAPHLWRRGEGRGERRGEEGKREEEVGRGGRMEEEGGAGRR